MKTLLFTLLSILAFFNTQAQTPEEEVKVTIERFFEGMLGSDTTKMLETLHPECTLSTVKSPKDKPAELQIDGMDKFIKSVATPKNGLVLDERISSYDIKIDGPMAIAWTPYEFYVNDKFSHCGVNVFTLIKTGSGWKISSIIDTRRKENCIEK